MSTNRGDMPANPVFSNDLGYIQDGALGMTIREQMAMAAMQGLLAGDGVYNPGDLAIEAVSHADDLLAQLERTK